MVADQEQDDNARKRTFRESQTCAQKEVDQQGAKLRMRNNRESQTCAEKEVDKQGAKSRMRKNREQETPAEKEANKQAAKLRDYARKRTFRESQSDMEILRDNFEQHPDLALVYFWSCGPEPDAFACLSIMTSVLMILLLLNVSII
jgi:hypothetical protein